MQGKDREKIHLKLEGAQQTVQVGENDYAQSTRALQDTMLKWEQDRRRFVMRVRISRRRGPSLCAGVCQRRVDGVSDNEVRVCLRHRSDRFTHFSFYRKSCEKMRLALEQSEPEKDMESAGLWDRECDP